MSTLPSPVRACRMSKMPALNVATWVRVPSWLRAVTSLRVPRASKRAPMGTEAVEASLTKRVAPGTLTRTTPLAAATTVRPISGRDETFRRDRKSPLLPDPVPSATGAEPSGSVVVTDSSAPTVVPEAFEAMTR